MNTSTLGNNNLFGKSISSNKQSSECEKSIHRLCSGRKCARIAKNLLMISYIKKAGYFCDECAHDLLAAELAVRLPEVLSTD